MLDLADGTFSRACPVCGNPNGTCPGDLKAADVIVRAVDAPARIEEGHMGQYYSRERVFEIDPVDQVERLKYGVGDPIPEEEAVRQGQVDSKGKPTDDAVTAPDPSVGDPGPMRMGEPATGGLVNIPTRPAAQADPEPPAEPPPADDPPAPNQGTASRRSRKR